MNNYQHLRQQEKEKGQHGQKTLEERLIEQESLYDNEQADYGIMYTNINVTELRIEIAQKTTHAAWSMKKSQLSQLLYTRQQTERRNGTFTPGHEFVPNEERQIPICIDKKEEGRP